MGTPTKPTGGRTKRFLKTLLRMLCISTFFLVATAAPWAARVALAQSDALILRSENSVSEDYPRLAVLTTLTGAGVAGTADIEVRNARIIFSTTADGFLNIASDAAASPVAGDIRYSTGDVLFHNGTSWLTLATVDEDVLWLDDVANNYYEPKNQLDDVKIFDDNQTCTVRIEGGGDSVAADYDIGLFVTYEDDANGVGTDFTGFVTDITPTADYSYWAALRGYIRADAGADVRVADFRLQGASTYETSDSVIYAYVNADVLGTPGGILIDYNDAGTGRGLDVDYEGTGHSGYFDDGASGLGLYVGQDVRLGQYSSTDDDYVYFDTGTTEYLRWLDGSTYFEFSDDLTVAGERVNVGGTLAAIHYSNTGYFGSANGWDPNVGAPDIGLWLEFGGGESSGFYCDEDVAVIWSPGDADILRVYDEDNLPTGDPKFVIDSAGNVVLNRGGISSGAGVYYDSRITYFRGNNWDTGAVAAQDVDMRIVCDAYGDDDSYRLEFDNDDSITLLTLDASGTLSSHKSGTSTGTGVSFDSYKHTFIANNWDSVGLVAQDMAMSIVNDAYGDDDSYRLAVQNNAATTVAQIDSAGNVQCDGNLEVDGGQITYGSVEYIADGGANEGTWGGADLRSSSDNSYDLGTTAYRWRNLYLGGDAVDSAGTRLYVLRAGDTMTGDLNAGKSGTSTGTGISFDSHKHNFVASNWDSVGLLAQDVAMRLVNDAYGDDNSYRLAVQNNAGTTVAQIDSSGNVQCDGDLYVDGGLVDYGSVEFMEDGGGNLTTFGNTTVQSNGDNSYDLGTSTNRWRNLYLGDSITVGSSATRFGMQRVVQTADGTFFTHPGVNISLSWNSVSPYTLTVNNNNGILDYYDCAITVTAGSTAGAPSSISNDVGDGGSLSLSTANADSGWTAQVANEDDAGPGFVFFGTSWSGDVQGLVIYWW